MRIMLIGLGVAALAISGCSKKPAPSSAGSEASQTPVYNAPAVQENAPAGITQADLIAAAGSDHILFALDSSSLSSEAEAILSRQLGWLQQHPGVNITVEGHCDERGTRDYNIALGDRRAHAAAEYLMSHGIATGRIRTVSYGKERPSEAGSDEAAYAQNRRAVSVVVTEAN